LGARFALAASSWSMSPLLRIINGFIRWERRLLAGFLIIFLLAGVITLRRFYTANTVLAPKGGGTYIEGSIGEMQPLNPWFTVTNDVNRDIVSLVFSGLLRYNPETKEIEEDLASIDVDGDARIYTLTLKENIEWHDSTEENPHFVTSDDVVFTFQTVQDPEFPNSLLRQNFQGVEIEKLDERTVRFRLEEPYSFFSSNLTLGLIPARNFEGIPIGKLDQALDFAFNPIGSGPYAFRSLVQTDLSIEVTLERFPRPLEPVYRLERIIFRIFSDYPSLLSDLRNIDGVRTVPRNKEGKPIISRRFLTTNYTLPQYVALFLNVHGDILEDKQLRLGLQLGTDKQGLVESINESLIVDTPLLEIDISDWRYKFDPLAAQGAFFASDWHLPEKVRLQGLLEKREANEIGALQLNPIVLLDTGAVLTVTGSLRDIVQGTTINDAPITRHPSRSGAWIAALPTYGGTGSITLGSNAIRLVNPDGSIVDSFYIWRTSDPRAYKRAVEEKRLVDLFVESRSEDTTLSTSEQISVKNLFMEESMLRLRLPSDPTDIRINNAGKKLSLKLLTSSSPPHYQVIAENIKEQWAELGVHVGIEIPDTREEFEERLLSRDYDILLFGQSLLDNLDSYPYWHSSQMQKLTGSKNDLRIDAYNLSQYSSLEADTLLESIRQTTNEIERQVALTDLREILKADVPAIFLYSPLYTFAYRQDLQGIELKNLSLHSDRFLTLYQWYMKENRVFQTGKSWWSFFPWLVGAS
jgi:ABC-type transport system substrate-binding protein